MRHLLTLLPLFLRPSTPLVKSKIRSWQIFFLLTLSVSVTWGIGMMPKVAQAESPATAPASLKTALTQMDAAANSRNLKALMEFYGGNFSHADGLTRQQLEDTLTQLWKRYSKLTYRTELKSWKPEKDGVLAETVTYIKGTQNLDGRVMNLDAMLRSQQRFQSEKIVSQEILAERNQLTSGVKPPTVDLKVPEQVKVGQNFDFDAVVKEPLGEDLLLGAVIEEPVQVNDYFSSAPVNLELLPSGGIFKVGQAPKNPENRWLSAILVREEGMTMVTQRLRVVKQAK